MPCCSALGVSILHLCRYKPHLFVTNFRVFFHDFVHSTWNWAWKSPTKQTVVKCLAHGHKGEHAWSSFQVD